ncbi:MAG: carbohydrate porin [Pseudomonadota bacterium]|nr:carbohydrate porin [Pseudomonadota bacterium]
MLTIMRRSNCVFALLVMGGLVLSISPACAADIVDAQALSPLEMPPVADIAPTNYDSMRPKGWIVGLPGPADMVDQYLGLGGFRSKLANEGIYYFGFSTNSFADNENPSANRGGTQLYNGQKTTLSTQNLFGITYDLSRFGIPDGQFLIWGAKYAYTWQPGGPSKFGLAGATYYQTLFNKKVEFKIGYLDSSLEFVGTNVGGSLSTSVFGPLGSIPYQGGENNVTTPTPGVIVKYNFDQNFYTKATIQRAVSPDGFVTEVGENPSGFDWRTANTGVLYLDETGYQRAAAPGVMQTWVRAGAAYNTSRYTSLETPGTRTGGNSWYYFLVDRQLWQIDGRAGSGRRGVYGGFSVMYAPPNLNRFTQYYELRLYGQGLLDSRPDDLVSLVATSTAWSPVAIENAEAAGSLVHRTSQSITATYSAHIAKGVYGSLGLSLVNHPTTITYTPATRSAVNLLGALNIFF